MMKRKKPAFNHAARFASFLDAQSAQAKKDLSCPDCGRVLQLIDTHFFLYGTGRHWNIPMPFCLVCHQEMLQELSAVDELVVSPGSTPLAHLSS
jgi:hypothetical protein